MSIPTIAIVTLVNEECSISASPDHKDKREACRSAHLPPKIARSTGPFCSAASAFGSLPSASAHRRVHLDCFGLASAFFASLISARPSHNWACRFSGSTEWHVKLRVKLPVLPVPPGDSSLLSLPSRTCARMNGQVLFSIRHRYLSHRSRHFNLSVTLCSSS